jgi:hypothetical protein
MVEEILEVVRRLERPERSELAEMRSLGKHDAASIADFLTHQLRTELGRDHEPEVFKVRTKQAGMHLTLRLDGPSDLRQDLRVISWLHRAREYGFNVRYLFNGHEEPPF